MQLLEFFFIELYDFIFVCLYASDQFHAMIKWHFLYH